VNMRMGITWNDPLHGSVTERAFPVIEQNRFIVMLINVLDVHLKPSFLFRMTTIETIITISERMSIRL